MSSKGWSRTAMVVCVAAIAFLMSASPSRAVKATGFSQSSGALISNWYWLRTPGASARWEFGSTPEAQKSTGCDIWIDALVTNTSSGGSGHDKHLDLTLSSGGKTHTFRNVFLDNKAQVTETDSKGAGYLIRGFLIDAELTNPTDRQALIDICGKYRDTGKLTVSYAWRSTASEEPCCNRNGKYAHHVAVNKDTMQVFFYYGRR